MKKKGIEPSQKIIRNCEFCEMETFQAVVEMLTNNDRPTAIFSFNSLKPELATGSSCKSVT